MYTPPRFGWYACSLVRLRHVLYFCSINFWPHVAVCCCRRMKRDVRLSAFNSSAKKRGGFSYVSFFFVFLGRFESKNYVFKHVTYSLFVKALNFDPLKGWVGCWCGFANVG